MQIGVVVRDCKGLVYAALSRTTEAYPEPVIEETIGALCASEFCRDLGL